MTDMQKYKNVAELCSELCTGCGACSNACPVNAIDIETDSKGYYIPNVKNNCINCRKCVSVCPVLNPQYDNNSDPECYAVMLDNEVRKDSSSGGAFTLFARYFLENGGLVCGAVLGDDFIVRHIIIDNINDLSKLRKSKYVQSYTGKVYQEIKKNLEKGKKVLFSGCPCQVAGLKNYLGKNYDNLLLLDLVCHGAPPSSAFRKYLDDNYGLQNVEKFEFRIKETGYNCDHLVCYLKNGEKLIKSYQNDAFEKCMHTGLALKKACAECLFAETPRQGDISIGDFWGIEKFECALNDGLGTSAVIINNEKGKKVFEYLKNKCKVVQNVPFDFAKKHNRYFKKLRIPGGQKAYYEMLKNKDFNTAVNNALNKKFDVGVIGWWYNKNYGADLTYFALHNVLCKMGLTVLMIQTKGVDYNAPSFKFAQKKYDISKYYTSDDIYLLREHCDTFISGSDQLFNPILWNISGVEFLLHFGSKVRNNLISYASSFGQIYDDKKHLKPKFSFLLKRFNALSVREKYAVDICKKEFGLDVPCVCDPVFLCDVKEYEKLADESGLTKKGKFLLNYILDPDDEKRELILNVSKKLNLDYVNLTDMDHWQKKSMELGLKNTKANISIEEWLFYYKNAEFVITDSFHGTCFALIFRKPFISLANHGRGSNRFKSLLSDFGLMDHLVDNISSIKEMPQLFEPIDYERAFEKMHSKIQMSYNWLENAIKNPNLSKNISDIEFLYEEMIELNGSLIQSYQRLLNRVQELENIVAKTNNKCKGFTWLKQKLYGGIQCYKDNGLKYTIKRIIFKIQNKLS